MMHSKDFCWREGKKNLKMKCEMKQPQRCSSSSGHTSNRTKYIWLAVQIVIMRDQMQTSLFPCSSNQSAVALLFTQSVRHSCSVPCCFLLFFGLRFCLLCSPVRVPQSASVNITFGMETFWRFKFNNTQAKWIYCISSQVYYNDFYVINILSEKKGKGIKKLMEIFIIHLNRAGKTDILLENKNPINLQLERWQTNRKLHRFAVNLFAYAIISKIRIYIWLRIRRLLFVTAIKLSIVASSWRVLCTNCLAKCMLCSG